MDVESVGLDSDGFVFGDRVFPYFQLWGLRPARRGPAGDPTQDLAGSGLGSIEGWGLQAKREGEL